MKIENGIDKKSVEDIKWILDENLVTLAKYNTGDEIHLLAVCKELNFDILESLKDIKQKPILFTTDEIENARDVFPVEFLHIKRHHTIIYGEDILKDIEITKVDLRKQLEFEFRSKLVHLRQAYLVASVKDIDNIILAAVPTMAPIIGGLMYLKDVNGVFSPFEFNTVYGVDTEILMDIYNVRKGNGKLQGDRDDYIVRLVGILEDLGKIVDAMKVE